MALLIPERALEELRRGQESALSGDVPRACFSLAWAMLSLRASGHLAEAAEAALHLAWAQGLDGRTWQAARTLAAAISGPGFARLDAGLRTRGHLLYAWALWDLGDYAGSREQATLAHSTSERPADRGRALLNLGQVALHLGGSDEAQSAFEQAVSLDPSLKATACGIKAYLHNLAGRHLEALDEARAGLEEVGNAALGKHDITNRAVEQSALMVERATAKAFLGHSDALSVLNEAQATLKFLPFDTQLEAARIQRAKALVLGKAGEHQAALALLAKALKVFRRRSALPDHDLTVCALNRLQKKRSEGDNDAVPA